MSGKLKVTHVIAPRTHDSITTRPSYKSSNIRWLQILHCIAGMCGKLLYQWKAQVFHIVARWVQQSYSVFNSFWAICLLKFVCSLDCVRHSVLNILKHVRNRNVKFQTASSYDVSRLLKRTTVTNAPNCGTRHVVGPKLLCRPHSQLLYSESTNE